MTPNKELHMSRKKKTNSDSILVVPKNATLKQISAIYRQQFTAADLQKFTELDEGIPMEDVIAELEKIQLRETRKKRKKKA
jgi:hypothetical protein